MATLLVAQLGESGLSGASAHHRERPKGVQALTADALLAKGPIGGPNGPQGRRHRRILAGHRRIEDAMLSADTKPDLLHKALMAKENSDLSSFCKSEAQSRLATVVLDRVRRSFLCASVAHPRDPDRRARVRQLVDDLDWADKFKSSIGEDKVKHLVEFNADSEALTISARINEIRVQGLACARESQMLDEAERLNLCRGEDLGPRFAKVAEQRGKLIAEAMVLLKQWTRHSQLAKEVLGALMCMADIGGEEFVEEMDRRGLAMLTSTVADVWCARPEVARLALLLLGKVSVELLVTQIQESLRQRNIVYLGLVSLNRLARDRPEQVESIAEQGGREMLDEVEEQWSTDQDIALSAVSLRRRLRRTRARSLRPKTTVELPPEEVVRIRGCFDALDEEGTGILDLERLCLGFQLMGIQVPRQEAQQAVAEVDLDGSGKVEWPEFLYLISRYSSTGGIESQFTQERLAELREVFSLFDKDGSGGLDVKELGLVMRSLGLCPTDMEIQGMINEVDVDHSGCIEFHEFLYLMSRKVADPENQHRLAFQFFDQERFGFITRDNFVRQMQELSNEFSVEDLDEMILQAKFENADLDTLTYKEFVKMMMRS